MSKSQLHNLKSRIKNGTEVTLSLSSEVIDNSSDETSIPHKLLLTFYYVSRIRKTFANGLSASIRFQKN